MSNLVDWPVALVAFAAGPRAAAVRADALVAAGEFSLSIDQHRLNEDAYRAELVASAAKWRGNRRTSTVYTMTQDHLVPSSLVDRVADDAHHHLLDAGMPWAFAQREGRADSRCLYVGHTLEFDKRLRQHLGDGPPTTSALNLKHQAIVHDGPLMVQTFASPAPDVVLTRLFEEHL